MTNPFGRNSSPSMNFVGLEQQQVQVQSIDSNNMATVTDRYGRYLPSISVYNMSGSGALPQAGEIWMVNRSNGSWTFASRVQAVLPEVSSADDLPQALSQLGLISLSGTTSRTAVPSGTVLDFAGSAAPSGWLICDGSPISRSLYAALFTAIGTVWGIGDGSTTFNLPDLRGRVTVGAGLGAGLTNRTLAGSGGEETHLLVTGEMPSHTHPDSGHQHQIGGHTTLADGSAGWGLNVTASFQDRVLVNSSGGQNTTTGNANISNTGGGTGHNNMQPFAALSKIIKT